MFVYKHYLLEPGAKAFRAASKRCSIEMPLRSDEARCRYWSAAKLTPNTSFRPCRQGGYVDSRECTNYAHYHTEEQCIQSVQLCCQTDMKKVRVVIQTCLTSSISRIILQQLWF
jgi:hypothetical protein